MPTPDLVECLGLVGFKVGKDNTWMVERITEFLEEKLRDGLTIFGDWKSGWCNAFVTIFEAYALQKMFVQV